MNLVYLFDS